MLAVVVSVEILFVVSRGKAVVAPMSMSCRRVFSLEMVVGWTEADGRLKSQ